MSTLHLNELNENQRNAVLYNEGPSLVIAGAGSGKTRVLTFKIAYLLEQGMKPWNILALTFTNKAAREMQERIARQVGAEQASGLWMGTFHSIFSKILRLEAGKLGFTSNYTIYDQSDSRSLLKSIIKEMGLDEKIYKPALINAHISNAKNRLVLPEVYAQDAEIRKADTTAKIPSTSEIYLRYQARCRQADAMDFDDLLLYTYILLKKNPEVRAHYASRFHYVLVDEYQDTNYAQHSIVWELTHENQKVCVVGDDAQSIYSFRGANIDNILNFNKIYKDVKLYKLEQNYRSTQTIVNAANSLIEHNNGQIRKEVFSEKKKGKRIPVLCAYSDAEEANIVINNIKEIRRKEAAEYAEFAILYRTNAQSRVFEEALRKHSVPYRIYGGLSFYQRKEIKDVIAYFRMAVNPNDEEAFKRVINYPLRGIGQTTVDKIISTSIEAETSLWKVVCNPQEYNLPLNKGTLKKVQGFCDLIQGFVNQVGETDAGLLGQMIIKDSGIMAELYQDNSPENLSRQENVEELINGINDFVATRKEEGLLNEVKLTDFLQEVALLSDLDQDKGEDDKKVTLMTIHSAKGLEFRNVFIVGMEENLFPSQMSGSSQREMEEERRLFYVALTRAEENCFLSFARSRYRYGKIEFSNPSRFLKDIDARFLDMPQEDLDFYPSADREQASLYGGHSRSTSSAYNKEYFASPSLTSQHKVLKPANTLSSSTSQKKSTGSTLLQEGQTIRHERFGIGKVTKVEGSGENVKATVAFQHSGIKQLLLKFARFTIVES